jgi:endonuclease YncB( thermonuclease family)
MYCNLLIIILLKTFKIKILLIILIGLLFNQAGECQKDSKVIETRKGTIVSVHDGDTFTFKDNENNEFKIRLAGIDAPELKQEFGKESRDFAKQYMNRKTEINVIKIDKYGRKVAEIYIEDTIWVNYKMVKAGWAVHYKKYSDNKILNDAEIDAKNKKKGVWSDTAFIMPWDYRHKKN